MDGQQLVRTASVANRHDDRWGHRDQGKLFYDFRLEDRIPETHLLRRMNRSRRLYLPIYDTGPRDWRIAKVIATG
jgi:hypothetical protein